VTIRPRIFFQFHDCVAFDCYLPQAAHPKRDAFSVETFTLDAAAGAADPGMSCQQVGSITDAGYSQTFGSHLLKEFAECVYGCQNRPC
jgi:hypothetical protein